MAPALSFDSDTHLLRKRAEAIIWIKTQMAKHGLHLVDLQHSGCFAEPPSVVPAIGSARYRDAIGNEWNGQGMVPDWLQRAVNAGQSIEHFEVD